MDEEKRIINYFRHSELQAIGNTDIRNNYFSNCGIDISGDLRDGAIIMNNKITGGTILLYDEPIPKAHLI